MKRRNFLKFLSCVPFIGIPVVDAKEKISRKSIDEFQMKEWYAPAGFNRGKLDDYYRVTGLQKIWIDTNKKFFVSVLDDNDIGYPLGMKFNNHCPPKNIVRYPEIHFPVTKGSTVRVHFEDDTFYQFIPEEENGIFLSKVIHIPKEI